MKVRPMTVRDIEQVAEIELACFPRPWSEEALYRDFSQNERSSFFVVEDDSTIVGHIGLWRQSDSIHVTTLGVRPGHRRNGIGTELVKKVFENYPSKFVTLEVRESNERAQKFYRSLGFREVGRRPSYYSDNGEDALVMSNGTNARDEVVADGHPRRS